jgi:O-antigen ligase
VAPNTGRLESIGTADLAGSPFASMQVSTALAIAGFLILSSSWKLKAFLIASIPFMLNAIILMATRAAFVALLASAPIAFAFTHKSRKFLVLSFGALGVALFFMLANDFFWERMGTILAPAEGGQMEASAASRFGIASANLRMFMDHPLGVGHRGNDMLSPAYMPDYLLTSKDDVGRVRSAHNTELAVLVDHGIFGVTLFLLFHLQIWRTFLRLRRNPDPNYPLQQRLIVAALATSHVLYWASSQFANFTKTEFIVWMAAIAAAMESHVRRSVPATEGEPRTSPQQVAAARAGRRLPRPASIQRRAGGTQDR